MTRSPRFWMFLPVVLLLGSLGMGATTVFLATHDPAFAVEEDYYQRSQHVDERLAAEAASRALGWKIRVIDRAVRDTERPQLLAFRVLDPGDQPVLDLQGELRAFHNARAAQVQEVSLRPDPERAGVYLAELHVDRSGWWVFRYELSRGEQRAIGETRSKLFVERGL